MFRATAILLSFLVGAVIGESRVDRALFSAAQKAMPGNIATNELAAVLQAGVWNSNRATVAVSVRRATGSVVFVFLRQRNGAFLACDASGVEEGNFGKLGRPRKDYERFETMPTEWLHRPDGWFQVNVRTQAWRGGQRFSVSEPLLIKPDGTVLYR